MLPGERRLARSSSVADERAPTGLLPSQVPEPGWRRGLDVGGPRSAEERRPELGARGPEHVRAARDRKRAGALRERRPRAEEGAVGRAGHRHPLRHREAGGHEPGQAGALAAGEVDGGRAGVGEREHVDVRHRKRILHEVRRPQRWAPGGTVERRLDRAQLGLPGLDLPVERGP